MGGIISIRLKILAIVLGFFSLVAAAFFVYSEATTANYRQLRVREVSKTVAFESERVDKTIAEMERDAIDLALAGAQFYRSGRHHRTLGMSVSVENFSAFTKAVGGGIWFEPYALDSDARRVCYYALYDPSIGRVRHEPEFESEAYDYHTQAWYKEISARVKGKHNAVWTAPYFDATGTNSLMTTVGAGIYNAAGRFIGMSTVDWQIKSMVDNLSVIKPTQNSFVLLASTRHDYIIFNTLKNGAGRTGSSLKGLPWYDKLRFSDDNAVGVGGFSQDGVEYASFSRVLDNGWLFSVQIPLSEIFARIEKRNIQYTFIIALASLVLLALASTLLSRLINRPLQRLMSGVAELGGGNLDKQLEIPSRDEIGMLALAFNKMTVDLKASIEQSARERAEKERIGAELNIAAHIQASMLPCVFPPFPDRREFDIYASMQPAKEVGGDFFDFFLIGDDILAVVIADVSGKGVPAALFMVIAKTLIKNNAQYGKTPGEVFKTVNNLLCENNDTGMFVTAFMGYFYINSGRLKYVSAGHNPPLLRSGATFNWLDAKSGFVLGGIRGVTYKENEVSLKQGDGLFLYTDGVTEAMNGEKQLFGNQRLLGALNRYASNETGAMAACASGPSPDELIMSISREIDSFAGGEEQADDIAMLALEYHHGNVMTNELLIEASLDNLGAVLDFVNARIEGCSGRIRNQINIAVDEAFSNIARHAYHASRGGAVVRVAANDDVVIEFEDSGAAYNPLLADAPDLSLPADERHAGGLGVFLLKNIMDSVEYRRDGSKNILTLRKRQA